MSDSQEIYSLENLGMAYRKAKVDLYYSPRVCRNELYEYEKDLEENLKRLAAKLIFDDAAPDFGPQSWTLVPKRIEKPEPSKKGFVRSDSKKSWDVFQESSETKVKAEFRLMEALSIDYHVFASLWVQHVGCKFDQRLSSSARGNRLRRKKDEEINPLSMGSQNHYLHAYRKWRDDGFKAMQDALEDGKSVITLTADVTAFYHNLNPSFMLKPSFHKLVGIDLTQEQLDLHNKFIESLKIWSEQTPIKNGLPVGLVASSIIANMAMYEFDKIMNEEIIPLYYGRYVDDIILVMENTSHFKGKEDVWSWIEKRSNNQIQRHSSEGKKYTIFSTPYHENTSQIHFDNGKNCVYQLEGQTGKTMVSSITRQICERSSEWRSFPDLPTEGTQVEASILNAIQANGEHADALRKTDSLTVRRANFAIKMRDIEAYNRALPPEKWENKRCAFLDAFIRHVLVLPVFFDFYAYLPRVIQIATSCSDFKKLSELLSSLGGILVSLQKCDLTISAVEKYNADNKRNPLEVFKDNLINLVYQSIEASFPFELSPEQNAAWQEIEASFFPLVSEAPSDFWQHIHTQLYTADLAQQPYKYSLLPEDYFGPIALPSKPLAGIELTAETVAALLNYAILQGIGALLSVVNQDHSPTGLWFPTRPLNLQDLYLIHQDPFSVKGRKEICLMILSLRGFNPHENLPYSENNSFGNSVLHIPVEMQKIDRLRIAVASWKTDENSWAASIVRDCDPDESRLDRLLHLLNQILRSRAKPEYLVFPELSLPRHWFLAVIRKLQNQGISFISGVEYLHAEGDVVRNQVWAALRHDSLGFPSYLVYIQEKQRPAIHEESELERIGGIRVEPCKGLKWKSPPLLNHGGFYFSVLVCSELTNIVYRAYLRGQVDGVFVPEWNQDMETFSTLVESSALDIHAYVIQCNNREHGDSRIRAPYRETWQRDIVRIKGGEEDYFVVGEIDIQDLRQFQSNHRSPNKPFKPVPDGFEIIDERKVVPNP